MVTETPPQKCNNTIFDVSNHFKNIFGEVPKGFRYAA